MSLQVDGVEGGRATARAVARRTLVEASKCPPEAEVGIVGEPTHSFDEEGDGSRDSSGIWDCFLLRRRGDGTCGRSTDPKQGGLARSPDQVVGQGLLYNQSMFLGSQGCGRDWRIGPDSVEGRDNITLPEQRARGPRWSLLSEPEAGRYRVRAGGVRRRDISDEGHVKPGSARGYADLALKLGRFGEGHG